MADAKISALTAATTPLAGTEVLPIVQSGTTKKVSVANLTAGRVVGMLRANIEGAYDAAAPSTSSVPILRVNEGGAVSLWVNGQGYSNVWVQAIQDDGSNNLKPLYLQPLGGDIYTGANIVPQVAAQGVNFTANTPAAGMTSQLLNWYEEGTFTPTAGVTLTSATGRYTRIGRAVHFVIEVVFPTTASTAGASLAGLPFTASANNYPCAVWTNRGSAIFAYVQASSTDIGLYNVTTGGIYDYVDFSADSVKISGTYFV